jgi:hypothetical protein
LNYRQKGIGTCANQRAVRPQTRPNTHRESFNDGIGGRVPKILVNRLDMLERDAYERRHPAALAASSKHSFDQGW